MVIILDLDISVHTLRNFISTADMGNITNAAEKLHITQPALSRQISSLEEKLNVPIFLRVKGGVALTDAGKKFYDYAQDLVVAYDTFNSKACALQNLIVGTLKIGHQKSSQELVIGLRKVFQRSYPYVSIVNREQVTGFLLDKLRADSLHGIFIYQNEITKKYTDIDYLHLGYLRNMLLVPASSPLAQQDSVSIAELSGRNFIIPGKFTSPGRHQEIIAHCEAAGFTPDIISYPESILDIISDVVRYDAVTVLPYIYGTDAGGQVKYLELSDYPQKYPLAFAWRASNDDPALAAYVKFLRTVTSEMTEEYIYSQNTKNHLLEILEGMLE